MENMKPPATVLGVAGISSSLSFGNDPSNLIDWNLILGLPKFQAFALEGARSFYPSGQFRPLPKQGEVIAEIRIEEIQSMVYSFLNEVQVRTITKDNLAQLISDMSTSINDHVNNIFEQTARLATSEECYVSIGNIDNWLEDYCNQKVSQIGETKFFNEYKEWHDKQAHYANEDVYGKIK